MLSGPCVYEAEFVGLKPRLSCMKHKDRECVESQLELTGKVWGSHDSGGDRRDSTGMETGTDYVTTGKVQTKTPVCHRGSRLAREGNTTQTSEAKTLTFSSQDPFPPFFKTLTYFLTTLCMYIIYSDHNFSHFSVLCPSYSPLDPVVFQGTSPLSSASLGLIAVSYVTRIRIIYQSTRS